jgi:hypothetical protein
MPENPVPAAEGLSMKLPQLSLRELFLLVVIVAIGCGWWVERGERIKFRRLSEQLVQSFRFGGGSVRWSDYNGKGWVVAISHPERKKLEQPERVFDEFHDVLTAISNSQFSQEEQMHQARGARAFAMEHIHAYPDFFEPTEMYVKLLNEAFDVYFPDHTP